MEHLWITLICLASVLVWLSWWLIAISQKKRFLRKKAEMEERQSKERYVLAEMKARMAGYDAEKAKHFKNTDDGAMQDATAFRQDWNAVGRDIDKAMERFEEGIEQARYGDGPKCKPYSGVTAWMDKHKPKDTDRNWPREHHGKWVGDK